MKGERCVRWGWGGAEVVTREQNEVRREPREYLRKELS